MMPPAWLNSFDDIFLSLDNSAAIQQMIGKEDFFAGPVGGLAWQDFIRRYADSQAIEGLRCGWMAIVERRVAPDHWPAAFPFRSGWVVSLRPVEDQGVAAHIFPSPLYALEAVVCQPMLDSAEHLVRLSHRHSASCVGRMAPTAQCVVVLRASNVRLKKRDRK